jgi:pimeloyl-ACP methyl ester carboxylesterase
MLPTHPGWEGTPRPDSFSSVGDLALAYLELLEGEDLRDVVLVGLSFGGWIASEMAIRDRDRRLGRLVLVDAIGPAIPGYQVCVPLESPPLDVAYIYGGKTLGDPELVRRLRTVETPTLMIWGERDTVVPPEFGRLYSNAFANNRFALIPSAGHMPVREAPEATFTVIESFLAGT